MDKLNDFLTKNIYEINKCVIHYGEYYLKDKEIIFNKKISKERFDSLLSKFVTNKYSVKRKIVYNYKNYFYDLDNNKAYRKINCNNFKSDYNNLLIETYNKEDINYTKFSCKKDYDNIYDYELTQISLAPELNLNFVQEKNFYTFTIEINVDANIDNTIHKLDKLLTIL
jgi:hypothetical protein